METETHVIGEIVEETKYINLSLLYHNFCEWGLGTCIFRKLQGDIFLGPTRQDSFYAQIVLVVSVHLCLTYPATM